MKKCNSKIFLLLLLCLSLTCAILRYLGVKVNASSNYFGNFNELVQVKANYGDGEIYCFVYGNIDNGSLTSSSNTYVVIDNWNDSPIINQTYLVKVSNRENTWQTLDNSFCVLLSDYFSINYNGAYKSGYRDGVEYGSTLTDYDDAFNKGKESAINDYSDIIQDLQNENIDLRLTISQFDIKLSSEINSAYNRGLNDATSQNLNDKSTFLSMVNTILSYPLNFIKECFNFTLFGFPVAGCLLALIGLLFAMWVIRRFL